MRQLHFKSSTNICYLGVYPGKYVEILIKNKYFKGKKIGIKGRAKLKNELENSYVAHIAYFY